MQVRGRYLVIAWTAVFLAAMGIIVVRDGAGFRMQKRVDSVQERAKTLEGIRQDLVRDISTLGSHDVLAPKVQAFGLRYPSDSELTQLPMPARR